MGSRVLAWMKEILVEGNAIWLEVAFLRRRTRLHSSLLGLPSPHALYSLSLNIPYHP
uniref:Uncharacterized protein n=1 Tax=Picea sitchensis TaxID=3332 RepID=D5A918_PICSI|nr:unknown [Picea sitchensis]